MNSFLRHLLITIIVACLSLSEVIAKNNEYHSLSQDESIGLNMENSILNFQTYPPDSVHYFLNRNGKLRVTIMIPEERDPSRVWTSNSLLAASAVVSIGILYSMPEDVTNWDKSTMTLNTITSKWYQNVTTTPVIDQDGWFLNYVMHPYFGGVYYLALRGAGYPWYSSALYSVGMSTFFWEYGFESLAEVPSAQDIIVTPIGGSILGEGMFQLKKLIKENDEYVLGSRAVGQFSMFLLDPLNQVQDWVRMRRYRNQFSTGAEINSRVMVLGRNVGLSVNMSF